MRYALAFRVNGLLLLILLALVSTSSACAQDWHVPYNASSSGFTPDSASVGYQLEPTFTQLLQQCNQGDFLKLSKKGGCFLGLFCKDIPEPKSSIPLKLQNHPGLDLSQHVVGTFPESVGRMFSYLFSASDYAGAPSGSVTFDESRMLKFDQNSSDNTFNKLRDPQSLIADPDNTFVYTSSCDSILSAAASVSSGITLPIATIKGSLSGSYDTSNKYTMQMVRAASFLSPLQDMLDDDDWGGYVNLLFWDLYSRPSNRAAGMSQANNYYLSQAAAIALSQSARSSTDASANVALGATVVSPYANFDSSFKTQLSSSNSATFSGAQTMLLNGFDKIRFFKQAPTPKTIKNEMANIDLEMVPHPSILLPGHNLIQMTMPGVPTSMCRRDSWTASLAGPSITTAAVAISSVAVQNPTVTSVPPACNFTLDLAIPSPVPGGVPSFQSNVNIALKQQLVDPDGNTYQVVLGGTTDDLTLSGSPTVDLSTPFSPNVPSPVSQTSGGQTTYTFSWQRDVKFTDLAADPIDMTKNLTFTAAMKCDSGNVPVQASSTALSTGNPHTASLKVTRTVFASPDGTVPVDISGKATEDCAITGTMTIEMVNPRSFATTIGDTDWKVQGPKPVPPPAPTPAVVPAPAPAHQ